VKADYFDADHFDQAHHFFVRHVIEETLVLFFQAFAKIFRGDKTCFPVGEVSAGLFAKFNKSGMREAYDAAYSIHSNFASMVSLWRVAIAFQM